MTDRADAKDRSEIVLPLDAKKKEFPEGVAVDPEGNLYFSVAPLGQVRRMERDGSQTIVAEFAIAPACTGALGLTCDSAGNVYAVIFSGLAETNGVWRIERDGKKQRLPGSEEIFFPNAVIFDEEENLYITESTGPPAGSSFELGGVWKFPRDRSATRVWLRHPLLTGTNHPMVPMPVPVGANGITYHDRHLFVANTEKMQVVRIPVKRDGSAGDPARLTRFSGKLDFLDGITSDESGNLYIVYPARNEVAKIGPENKLTTLATADDAIDFPASVVFDAGATGHKSLYVTNLATGPSPGAGPSVVRIRRF